MALTIDADLTPAARGADVSTSAASIAAADAGDYTFSVEGGVTLAGGVAKLEHRSSSAANWSTYSDGVESVSLASPGAVNCSLAEGDYRVTITGCGNGCSTTVRVALAPRSG